MPELLLVKFMHRLIERLKKLKALGRDACFHHPPVVLLSRARDQAALLHAIEKPRHVRIVRDHAVGYVAASQPFGFGAAQDAQRIVLGGGQIVGFQQLFHLLCQGVGCFLQGDKNMGLE